MKRMWLSYIAGFFDGEGTVSVYRHYAYQAVNSYFLYASVSQRKSPTSVKIARALQKEFGGSCYESTNASGTTMWRWQANRDSAVPFLKAIYPYVIVKKKQIRVALYWQENKVDLKPGPIPKHKTAEVREYLKRSKHVAKYMKELKKSA